MDENVLESLLLIIINGCLIRYIVAPTCPPHLLHLIFFLLKTAFNYSLSFLNKKSIQFFQWEFCFSQSCCSESLCLYYWRTKSWSSYAFKHAQVHSWIPTRMHLQLMRRELPTIFTCTTQLYLHCFKCVALFLKHNQCTNFCNIYFKML